MQPQQYPDSEMEFFSRSDVPFEAKDPLQQQAVEHALPQELLEFGAIPLGETMAAPQQEQREPTRREEYLSRLREERQAEKAQQAQALSPELLEFGAVPMEEPIGEAERLYGMGTRAVIPAMLGLPADMVSLADMAYQWMGGGGLVGEGLAGASDWLHPLTSGGIREAIDIKTDDKFAPKNILEKIGSTATEFLAAGGAVGALKKGKYVREIGGAVGAAALPELVPEDYHKTRLALTLIGDISGRGVISRSFRQELIAGGAALKEKIGKEVSPLSQEALKAAEELGFEVTAGMALDSDKAKAIESYLASTPYGAQAFNEAAGRINTQVIDKLEDTFGTAFSELPQKAAEISEEVQEAARVGLEEAATIREEAYKAMGEATKGKPVEAKVTKRVFTSALESPSVTPEVKKTLEGAVGDAFDTGKRAEAAVEKISKAKYTPIELGESVKEKLSSRKVEAKAKYKDLYDRFETGIKEEVATAKEAAPILKAFSDVKSKIGEWRLPDEFMSVYNKADKQAKKFAKWISSGRDIPLSDLKNLEKSLHQVIDYASEHNATGLFKQARRTVSDVIQNSIKNPETLALYKDSKKAYQDYVRGFVEPEAINKMIWTQKPEDIVSLLRKPSYYKQVVDAVGPEMAKSLKKGLIESLFGGENIAKGVISESGLSKLKEYKSVFGEGYNDLIETLGQARKKEFASGDKLLKAIERIDQRLAEPIGSSEKALLQKTRGAIIQDLKKAGPEVARLAEEGAGKIGSVQDQLRSKMLSSLATNDPSKILPSIKTAADLSEFKKAMGNTPRGRQMYDVVRDMKLQQELGKKIFNKEGGVSFAKMNTSLEKLTKSEFGRALIGKENLNLYEQLQKYAAGMEQAADIFANYSKTATTQASMSMFLYTMYGWGSLMAGNPAPIIKAYGIKGGIRGVSKFLTDPAVKKVMLENAKKTVPEILKQGITPERAYKLLKPAVEWGTIEMAKDSSP